MQSSTSATKAPEPGSSAESLPTPCRIIGVLDDGADSLSNTALQHLRDADLVIGGTRTLALFDAYLKVDAHLFDLSGQLNVLPSKIRSAQAKNLRVVVLATGDPLCHGIASYLQARLCVESCEVLPNVSTFQLACARAGIAWQNIEIVSVHSKDAGEWLPEADKQHGLYPVLHAAQHHTQLAVFTSPANSPDRIARMLETAGLADQFRMTVAQQLLQDDEKMVHDIAVEDAAKMQFADPNIVLLWHTTAILKPVSFGLPDDSFQQRKPEKGLITKREVRAVSLARLQLRRDSVLWDIGAGSGSVGLEAARLCPDGYVYAIEKNIDDTANAEQNRRDMQIHNYRVQHAKAPEGLDAWPSPDAVFVGGSGGNLAALIELILSRLCEGGWLVMNFVTIENLSAATEALKALGAEWDVTQLQSSRSKAILHMHRFDAQNPVWIVCAKRASS